MSRSTVGFIGGGVLILSIVSAPFLWRLWKTTRPVTPHVQLIFAQVHGCTLYLPYANAEDLLFVGASLSHSLETRGAIVHEITVSGTGAILYRNAKIEVGTDHIVVNGQSLTNVSCSYVLDRSNKLEGGAIQTYY